jgi:hypothetical protein
LSPRSPWILYPSNPAPELRNETAEECSSLIPGVSHRPPRHEVIL